MLDANQSLFKAQMTDAQEVGWVGSSNANRPRAVPHAVKRRASDPGRPTRVRTPSPYRVRSPSAPRPQDG